MKTLIILFLAGALALGGYLTKPTEEAHRANADTRLADQRGGFDVGELIGAVVGQARQDRRFEDLVVATRYTVLSGETAVLECLGLYAQFLCSSPQAAK